MEIVERLTEAQAFACVAGGAERLEARAVSDNKESKEERGVLEQAEARKWWGRWLIAEQSAYTVGGGVRGQREKMP